MIFNPKCVSKVVSHTFQPFTPCGVKLKFLTNFKYLGHIINSVTMTTLNVKLRIYLLDVICFVLGSIFVLLR